MGVAKAWLRMLYETREMVLGSDTDKAFQEAWRG